jgi:hypothetical protein
MAAAGCSKPSAEFRFSGTNCLSDTEACIVLTARQLENGQYRVTALDEDDRSVHVTISPATADNTNDAGVVFEVPLERPLGDRDVFVNGDFLPS